MSEVMNTPATEAGDSVVEDGNEVESSTEVEAQAPEGKKTPAPLAPAKRKLKYKVDDEEIEEELTEEELTEAAIAYRRKDKASDKRFQESAAMRKQAQQVFSALKSDTTKALKVLGIDPYEFAQKVVLEQIEESQLSDSDRRIRDLEAQIAEHKRQEEELAAKEKAEQSEKLYQQERQRLAGLINEALKAPNLPQGARTVRRMAELIGKNEQLGLDLTPRELAELVREEFDQEHREMYESWDAERLFNHFGPGVRNKIRQHELSLWKNPNKLPVKETKEPEPMKSIGNSKEELRKHHERILAQGD